MLKTQTRPVCRLARPEDDLSLCLGSTKDEYLNRDQCFVAELDGRILGMLVMWDGGHSVVMFDHFILAKEATADVGPKLILAVNAYCQQHGKHSMVFTTPSVELAYQAKRRGATVLGPMFRVTYPLTQLRGAHHA